jgi:hypothetical protein
MVRFAFVLQPPVLVPYAAVRLLLTPLLRNYSHRLSLAPGWLAGWMAGSDCRVTVIGLLVLVVGASSSVSPCFPQHVLPIRTPQILQTWGTAAMSEN